MDVESVGSTLVALGMAVWLAFMTCGAFVYEAVNGMYQAIRYIWWPDTKEEWADWRRSYWD